MLRSIFRRKASRVALRTGLALATVLAGCGARSELLIENSAPANGSNGSACHGDGSCDPGLQCLNGICINQAEATPSCAPEGPGMTDCGDGHESCCTSLRVEGGTFYRTYVNLGVGATDEADPATISSFRLDKYEVTVGRFRQFVRAATGADGGPGWMPLAGSGKHAHLNGGQGLANSDPDAATAYEAGWDPEDDDGGASPKNVMNFACDPIDAGYETWTESPATHEKLPINCVNSYTAYAFCIWDGGFLPSEAEWEYAAAGGFQQRMYPWGNTDPGSANQYAIYNCEYPSGAAGPDCANASNIAPVGTATGGAGAWGQLDLAGNMAEWTLDISVGEPAYVSPCLDCASLTKPDVQWQYVFRMVRGDSFWYVSSSLPESPYEGLTPPFRNNASAWVESEDIGFRCARAP
jgi:formylglycine-generating enzyme